MLPAIPLDIGARLPVEVVNLGFRLLSLGPPVGEGSRPSNPFQNFDNSWIPFDVSVLYEAGTQLRASLGAAATIGFYVFLGLTGLYVVIKIVSSLFQ